jgi:hypothetical protein
LREDNIGSKLYYLPNFAGLIYQGKEGIETLKSTDYGATFLPVDGTCWQHSEFGWQEEEVFMLGALSGYDLKLYHTHDLFQTYTEIPIGEEFMFGQVSGYFPDVYRGGKEGEVYIHSMFPEPGYKVSYKVSFSADTGYTFRHVFVSENFDLANRNPNYAFMSDREPGVFYITRSYPVEDTDPRGWHTRICVEYYRDYGETLVDIYCHDLTREGVVTRVDEVEKSDEIVVYPNPTEGQLRITNIELRITNIEIFNLLGKKQKIGQSEIGQSEISINISHLPSGMYFVRITTENGVVTRKVMKQ